MNLLTRIKALAWSKWNARRRKALTLPEWPTVVYKFEVDWFVDESRLSQGGSSCSPSGETVALFKGQAASQGAMRGLL